MAANKSSWDSFCNNYLEIQRWSIYVPGFFSLCVKPKLVFVTFVGILISRKQLCILQKFKDKIRKKYIFSTWKMRQTDEAKQFRTHTEMFCE